MATCWLSQTGAIFVLLAISKPCNRFRCSLYRFQPKSPHLSSGTLGFPSWGQVQSFLVNHAYASHTASRIPYLVHVLVVYYVVCFFRCYFFGLVLITSHLWGPIQLRPFVFFMDSFFFHAGSQARWPYPRHHFCLCLLVARSFAMPMLRYLPLACHASHIVKPSL